MLFVFSYSTYCYCRYYIFQNFKLTVTSEDVCYTKPLSQ